MNISDIKILDNLNVLKTGLSAVERLQSGSSDEKGDEYLAEICYRELCKRRREERDKFKRLLYDASYRELMKMMRKNTTHDKQIFSECHNEILWRWRLKELGGRVEMKTALQKLDELLSD
jgi:hypothetical protein